uniref:Uncharacterized protein n=1 Tax=Ascaris lumbricoides TaxID=6252 RepID=A0A9J2PPQ6_ASCLU
MKIVQYQKLVVLYQPPPYTIRSVMIPLWLAHLSANYRKLPVSKLHARNRRAND